MLEKDIMDLNMELLNSSRQQLASLQKSCEEDIKESRRLAAEYKKIISIIKRG